MLLQQRNCYLDFLHAVGQRVPKDTLDVWSQTFTLEGNSHISTLLLLTAGQHTPPQDTLHANEDKQTCNPTQKHSS